MCYVTSSYKVNIKIVLTLVHGEVVINWETPSVEMVAYRSFHPFFPLLTCQESFQVQLWAVWAIQHVCTKNGIVYIKF
jgi:hypothetical protein